MRRRKGADWSWVVVGLDVGLAHRSEERGGGGTRKAG